jgi:hypothetical protein
MAVSYAAFWLFSNGGIKFAKSLTAAHVGRLVSSCAAIM